MAKKYVYHYHAEYINSISSSHMDGIAAMADKIECMEDYQKLKQSIANLYELDLKSTEIIVTSLTLINEID